MASSKKFALVGVLALGCLFWTALTPQQIAVNSAVFGGYSDFQLETANTYLLASIAGIAINPANILSNAAGFGAYSDRQLQEAQTYLLSQITSSGGLPANAAGALTNDGVGNIGWLPGIGGGSGSGSSNITDSAFTAVIRNADIKTNLVVEGQTTLGGGLSLTGAAPTTVSTTANGMSNVISFTTGSNGINFAVGSYSNPTNVFGITNALGANGYGFTIFSGAAFTNQNFIQGVGHYDANGKASSSLIAAADFASQSAGTILGNNTGSLGTPGFNSPQSFGIALTNDQRALTLGGLVNVSTLNVTNNITNAVLTASRLVLSDANKALTSAAASGAVPVDADGSATTAAQINALGISATTTSQNKWTNVFVSATTNTITTGNGTATIDFSACDHAYLATNANITLNITGLDPNRSQQYVLMLSNSAASGTITITPTFVLMTNGYPASAVLLTNLNTKHQVAFISLMTYGPSQTNGVWANFFQP